MLYRLATPQDIPTLIELRKRQLIDEGSIPDTIINKELTAFFEHHLSDGSLIQWICRGARHDYRYSGRRLLCFSTKLYKSERHERLYYECLYA